MTMSRLTPFRAEFGCGFIDEALFNSAQRPIRRHLVDPRPRFLGKRAPCPVCNRNMQNHLIDGAYEVLKCEHKHDGEYVGVAHWFSAAAVEEVVIADLQALLDRDIYNEAYLATITDANGQRAADLEKLISAQDKKIVIHRAEYKNALRRHVTSALESDLEGILLEMKADLGKVEQERDHLRNALYHRNNLIIENQSKANQLSEALIDLAQQLPWRPEHKDEIAVFAIARAMLKQVRITLREDGLQDVAITFNLTEHTDHHPALTTTICHDGLQLKQRNITVDLIHQSKIDMFQYSNVRLTDAEFATMPRVVYRQKEDSEVARKLIDFLLVASDRGVSTNAFIKHFNMKTYVGRLTKIYSGSGLGMIQDHLRKTRGDEFVIKSPGGDNGFSERARLLSARHPTLLLPLSSPSSGVIEVTDGDWELIWPLLEPSDKRIGEEQMRVAFNAYFHCVREGISLLNVRRFGLGRKMCERVRFPSSRSLSHRVLSLLLPRYGYKLPTDYQMPVLKKKRWLIDEAPVIAELKAAMMAPSKHRRGNANGRNGQVA